MSAPCRPSQAASFLPRPLGRLARLACASLLVATAAVPAVASAQPAAPTQPTIAPPRLVTDSPAKYPEQALADKIRESVTVTLVLDIDVEGKVKAAKPESAAGHGFDEAAVAAAQGLVFDPAKRGDTPIPARIKFQYTFAPPASRVLGRVAKQPADTPIAGAVVTIVDASGLSHRTTTDDSGAFRVGDLPPGPLKVHVEAAGRKPADIAEDIGAGEETSLVVRLDAAGEAPPPPPPGAGGVNEEVEEVTVRGERPPREVTKRTIPREEIALIPGTNGDALRSLQNLPGVARPPPFGGQIVVRGAAPNDTQYFVDGTNVPIVYHFGGLSSVVPTEALDKIDFYPGNFGAMYGRGMGGIIDVGMRNPKSDGRTHGMAQLDLIDARFLVERSLGKGWSFLAAGRRSWFDVWLGPILSSSGGVSTAPRYYDYQLMVRKEFGPDHDLRILFFGSDDRIEIYGSGISDDFILGGGIRAKIAFWRAQARYQNRLGPNTRLTASASIGQDAIDFGFGANYADIAATPITGRAEVSHRIARPVTANLGIDILDTPYDVTVRFPRPTRPGIADDGVTNPSVITKNKNALYTPGAYAELELTPFVGTRIVPGFRADYTNMIKEWVASPRIVVRQDIAHGKPRTTIKGGAGMYYQPPSPQELDPVFGTPGVKSNRSQHYSVGFEQELGDHGELSVETFYKALDRLIVQDNFNNGEGRIYGAEWLLRWKNDPKFFGWIAYTMMRSERKDSPEELYRLFQYDQTHILTMIASRDLGHGWRIGGRFRFVSGNLYTPNSYYGALDVDRASYVPAATYPPFSERLDAFHQLDFRIDKSLDAKPLKLAVYLDIQNIYYHRSQEGTSYNFNYTAQEPVLGLPILPILGMRGDL